MSGLWVEGLIRFKSQHLDRCLEELEGAVIGHQRIATPVHRGSEMDCIRSLETGGGSQHSCSLHHLRMKGHHNAVGEEAAEGELADLITGAQWT